MGKEKDILNQLLIETSKKGARLSRVNNGLGWVGKIIRKSAAAITIENPRPLHAGLCVGSSDIIGWHSVVVTPEMVGQRVALFVALEVKTGRVATTKEQAAFVRAVGEAGGVSAVVRSVDEALDLLK